MGVCSQAMSEAGFNTGAGPTCSMESGYSFHVITAAPSGDQIKKICASAACKRVMAAMKAAQPSECNTGGPMWDFQVYSQIFNPIDQGCGAQPPPTAPPPTAPPPTAPPPTAPPPTAPLPTSPPTTVAPASPSTTTTPAPPATTTAAGGASSGETSAPTTAGSSAEPSAGTTTGQPTSSSSTTGNSTWTTQGPSSGIVKGSSGNNTSSSNINTTTTETSGSSSSTMIIAIVAGVVVVIAIVAFLAFRAGKRKTESPRELSYVDAPSTNKHNRSAAAGRSAPRGGSYVPSPLTDVTTTSAGLTRSSGALTRSAGRSETHTSNNSRASLGSNAAAVAGATGLWTDRAIEKARIPLEDIMMGDVLSQGAFGEVLRGSYNGESVAIKRLLPARRKDMKEIESFLEEAKLLTSLRHQRIVGFVGVAWDSLTDLCIVTEFMDGGDLRSLLSHANENDEPTGFDANKVKIALHIIHALSYLHGLKPIVVHRDLKSKNVLLTRDLDAKLTDFGVSRERADKTMTANVGSSLWMAPEVMMGERYDEKADIFSFGVVLSELDTQKLPYSHAKEPGTDHQIPEMAMLSMVSTGNLTVAFTEGADSDMVEIGRACVALDPTERPTASDVLRRMHHIYRSYRHV